MRVPKYDIIPIMRNYPKHLLVLVLFLLLVLSVPLQTHAGFFDWFKSTFSGVDIGNQTAQVISVPQLDPKITKATKGKLPGQVQGRNKHFEINDSNYANIVLESTNEIEIHVESFSNMITLNLLSGETTSTNITITNLKPNKKYFKYEDSLRNLEELITNANGEITFTQNTEKPHRIFIQTHKSTRFLNDNATGGSCTAIGSWNATTKTCTLNKNVTESIEIESDGITLDGNNFSVTGQGTGSGIFVNGRSGVKVKNLFVADFTYGVNFMNTVFLGRIENVELRENGRAINLDNAENVFVKNNIVSDNLQGINVYLSDLTILLGNSFNNHQRGVILTGSSFLSVVRNTVSNSTTAGFTIVLGGGFIYNNNLINNTNQTDTFDIQDYSFDNGLPTGGNYWSDYDTASEGCNDLNNDNICNSSYSLLGNQDNYPWKCSDGWMAPCPPPTSVIQSLVKPVDITDGKVKCFFPSYMRGTSFHLGIDIIGSTPGSIFNKNTIASAKGNVKIADNIDDSFAGKWVWIFHGDIKKLDGTIVPNISTRYLHLNSIDTSAGSSINQSDNIGKVGSTGRSTGPHLHFEVRQGIIPADLSLALRATTRLNPHLFVDYPAEKTTTLCAFVESPVLVTIIDPDGLRINESINEIGSNAQYWIFEYSAGDNDVEEDEYQLIFIENRKIGEYKFEVNPKSETLSTEVFDLTAFAGNDRIILADKVFVGSIPTEPYKIFSNTNGIEGDGANSLPIPNPKLKFKLTPRTFNLKSNGAITAHLEVINGDINQINQGSIKLNSQSPKQINLDDDSLTIKFERENFRNLSLGDVTFTLTGKFKDNSQFELNDTIKITNPGKSKQ